MKDILIIDDDEKLGQLLTQFLERHDMKAHVALQPDRGFALLRQIEPDLLILDVMLPDQDGFDICREIRANPHLYGHLPILMLTAYADVHHRIDGLEMGADDYLPKPFEPRELVARIQNILRRSGDEFSTAAEQPIAASGPATAALKVDRSRREVTLEGKELDLTTMEYELLVLFMQNPKQSFTRDEITSRVRGIDAEINSQLADNSSRPVDTLINRLRQKLGESPKNPHFIKTVRGHGYAFVGEHKSILT